MFPARRPGALGRAPLLTLLLAATAPDIQVLFHPTNGTEDTVLLLGARLNLAF